MRYILIFFLIISFSCSEDSASNDPNNNNPSGPSGNVFTFGDIDVTGQWDFDQNRGQINNFSEPRKREININIAQRDYDDSLDVGILSAGASPLSGQLSSNEIISCVVGNYGYLPIFDDFQVSYKIAYEDGEFGEEVFETYMITDSLASIDYTYFDFATTADFSQYGTYTIEMSTHMPNDMDTETDSFVRIVESLQYTDVCNIHSIILTGNNTFNLYTTNEEGISNYVILGDYVLDQDNNMLTLLVTESSGFVSEIGQIHDVEIDENGIISGTVNIEGLCVQLLDGYEEESYTSGLTYIPDENLEQWLVDEGYDDDVDGYMLTANAISQGGVAIYAEDTCYDEENNTITCDYDDYMNYETRFLNRLTSLAGIEAFPNLEILNLTGNDLDSINISQNSNLKYLYLNFNSFSKLDTSGNPNLEVISLDNNLIVPEVDFSENANMTDIAMPNIGFGSVSDEYIGPGGYFDITNMENLNGLSIGDNNFTSIDLSGNPNLTIFKGGGNNFTEIDISNLSQLYEFGVPESPITTIDFSGNPLLHTIQVEQCNLSYLDVSMLDELRVLRAFGNPNLNCIKVSPFQLDAIENNDPEFEFVVGGVALSLDCN